MTGEYVELNDEIISRYHNMGGFDTIGSGRDKIHTEEQFASSLKHCEAMNLHGLVVIGGDDSNTNACMLAEYFASKGSSVSVVGAPKTLFTLKVDPVLKLISCFSSFLVVLGFGTSRYVVLIVSTSYPFT